MPYGGGKECLHGRIVLSPLEKMLERALQRSARLNSSWFSQRKRNLLTAVNSGQASEDSLE